MGRSELLTVMDFGTSGKPICDFLLASNNTAALSHMFGRIANLLHPCGNVK